MDAHVNGKEKIGENGETDYAPFAVPTIIVMMIILVITFPEPPYTISVIKIHLLVTQGSISWIAILVSQ